LAAACAIGLANAASTSSGENATAGYSSWAADPTMAGPDLPPAGRSLFDFLFTETGTGVDTDRPDSDAPGTYQVPFPFPALIDRVRAHLGNREFMGGIRVAVIPMGRSLQRVAAAPEFFKYPRTVIAVTGEPRTSAHDAGMLLRDRLYIAYVEKTKTLEVISYNEAAGRFEFQLVKDYRAGAQPKVFYADRAICIACHQNHAPIFSLPTWRETNANGQIADMLHTHGTDMHLSAQANIDFPDDMEKATIRANDLVTLQTVWQQGCTDLHDASRGQRCRAAAFVAVLQYGLSGKRDFDSNAARYRDDFVATMTRAWSRIWPQGLRVAQSSLPDRNPFGGSSASYGSGGSGDIAFDWKVAASVPPALDPLTPRPPKAIWQFAGAMDTSRMISGWAGFFAADDFRTLDRLLVQGTTGAAAQHTVYRARCVTRQGSSAKLDLQCTGDPRAERPVNLVAHIGENGKGRIEWLNFGPAGTLRDVDLTGGAAQRTDAGYVLSAVPKKAALTTRLPDGRRLARVTIRWNANVDKNNIGGTDTERTDTDRTGIDQTGNAQSSGAVFEATVIDDFEQVQQAIDRLLKKRAALFDSAPAMRAQLMPALLAELESAGQLSPETTWCCIDDNGMPPAMLDVPKGDAAVLADDKLQPFYRYCATCHFTAERFPPNFLSGKASQVEDNLRRCAPRMLVRLSAWSTPEDERVKSPMPPATALPALGIATDQWARSNEFEKLRAYVEQLAQKTGPSSEDPMVAKEGYEALPSCLPPAQ